MRTHLASALAITALSLLSTPFLLNSRAAKPRQTPAVKKLDHLHKPAAPQGAEGGLWRTDGSFQANLLLKNQLDITPIDVTPVLYMADGTEYDLSPVELNASGVATVNINSALQSAPASIQPHISSFGSVGIRFSWSWAAAVLATVQNIDEPRSLVDTNPLVADVVKTHATLLKPMQESLDGMWWKLDPDTGGFVGLTNTSLSSITASIQVSNSGATSTASQSATLTPHSTTMIDLTPLWNELPPNSQAGAIHISYSGIRNALVAHGILEDDNKGYSQKLAFFPLETDQGAPAPTAKTVTVASPGIMIGAQDPSMQFPQNVKFAPYLVLRNTTTHPLPVQLAANYQGQSGPKDVQLGTIVLPPLAVQQADMKTLLTSVGLGNYNGYFNLSSTYSAVPGDLLEAAGSVDQSFTYVFEVPFVSETNPKAMSFCYWNTAGDTDSMMDLWNYSGSDEDLLLTFQHQAGQYQLPIHLAAHSSTSLSFASVIRNGAPDVNGNVIPANITQGSATLTGKNGDQDRVQIAAHLATFNVRTATCDTDCSHCRGFVDDTYSEPESIYVPVNLQLSNIKVWAAYSGGTYVDYSSQVTWDVENTEIATDSPSYSYDTVTGQAGGQTYLDAWPNNDDGGIPGDGGYDCSDYYDNGDECDNTPESWSTQITTQLPTSMSGPTGGTVQPFTGQDLIDCGNNDHGAFWGWLDCPNYQVLDQYGYDINGTISITETITCQGHSASVSDNHNCGFPTTVTTTTNSVGLNTDNLAFGFSSSPAPVSGDYEYGRQVIVWNTTYGTVTIRVNCLDYEYNGPTVTDVTSSGPSVTCSR